MATRTAPPLQLGAPPKLAAELVAHSHHDAARACARWIDRAVNEPTNPRRVRWLDMAVECAALVNLSREVIKSFDHGAIRFNLIEGSP